MFAMFFGIAILTGCEGQLSLTPMEDYGATPGFPEYNFSFRAMDAKLGRDTSYVVYKTTYQVDEGTDVSLVYRSEEIRANDWLNVTTSNFAKDKLYIRFIPITLGQTSVSITCTDDAKKSKTFKKSFFIVK